MSIPLKDLTFSVRFLEIPEALLRERHVPPSVLLDAVGLTEAQLHDPQQTINGVQLQRALVAVLPHCLTGQSVASQYLAHTPLTIIGPLASMLMACNNLGEALTALERFISILVPAYSISKVEAQGEVRMVATRLSDFGEVDDLLTEIVLGVFAKYHSLLVEPLEGVEYHFRHRQQGSALVLPGGLSRKVQYGASMDMVSYPMGLMSVCLHTRSRVLLQEAERSLEQLAKRDTQACPFSQQVRRVIRDLLVAGRLLHGDVVAEQMALARRTLNRRLEEEGTTLVNLISEVRMSYAENLLLTTNLPLIHVAQRAGFTEVSNFTRAFKRVFNRTPRQCRESAGAVDLVT